MLDVNETFRFIGLSVISEINTSAILKILLANYNRKIEMSQNKYSIEHFFEQI